MTRRINLAANRQSYTITVITPVLEDLMSQRVVFWLLSCADRRRFVWTWELEMSEISDAVYQLQHIQYFSKMREL